MRKRILILLGCCVLLCTAVWWTGKPQEYVLERILGQSLNTRVEVEGIHIGREIRCDSIFIYPSYDADPLAPFAQLHQLRVDYALIMDAHNRRISSIHIGLLDVSPDLSVPESPNFQFVLDLLEGESSTDTEWLPSTITLETVNMDVLWDNKYFALFDTQVEVACLDWDDMRVAIQLNDSPDDSHSVSGKVQVDLAGEVIRAEVKNLHLKDSEGTLQILVDALLPDVPLTFKQGTITIPQMSWDSSKGSYPDGQVMISLDALEIHQKNELLYAGDLSSTIQLHEGDKLNTEMSMRVHPKLLAAITLTQNELNTTGTIQFSDWEKVALVETIPPTMRSSIEELPFKSLGGQANFEWDAVKYALQGDVRSDGKAIDIDWSLHGEMESASSILGTVDARVGDGLLQASGKMDDAGWYRGEMKLKDVPLGPFMLLVTGTPLPKTVSGIMNGQVLAQQLDANRVQVMPKIIFKDTHYNDFSFESLVLEGPVVLDYETRKLQAETASLKTEDESIVLEAKAFQLNLDSGDLKGDLTYALPIETFKIENVYGTMSGTAALSKKGKAWSIPIQFMSDYIGYGDLALPYGSELTGKSVVQFSDDSSDVTLTETHAKIGEGTLLIIPKAQMDEAGWTGTAQVESELSLLVDMAYVAEVDGVFSAEADWAMPARGFTADWKAKTDIAKMVMNDQAATVSGIVAHLDGKYDGAFQGEGAIAIDRLDAAGAALTAFSGPLLFQNNVLMIASSTSRVFKGTLESYIEIRVMDEGLPVDFKGKLKDINLATLTEEVQPPKTKMTGLAKGTFDAQYSLAEGLIGFDLKVDSDKNFTLNRSLVEEMMQMQTVLGGLSEKRAKKAMDKFLGKADQRPFDFAGMNVFLLNGSVLGVTELQSEKVDDYNGLNLVIQLDIDKPALVQSLKMLEESSLADVEF